MPPRAVIENISPELDHGRFPVKRVIGDEVVVDADIYADGHDRLSAVLRYRHDRDQTWRETTFRELGHDRWRASFRVDRIGTWHYTIVSWVDTYTSWLEKLEKKTAARQASPVDFIEGAQLIEETATRTSGAPAAYLLNAAAKLRSRAQPFRKLRTARSARLSRLMTQYADRAHALTYDKDLLVTVDREKARFSAWYELFIRSCTGPNGEPGTFKTALPVMKYAADMGFDVLYLPPIHPIGVTARKGCDNTVTALPGDPGTPWAVGSEAGGHTAIHPQLGTLEDFREFLGAAGELGLEVALDMAFQCSPDHPWVREHPQWFRHRPDGSIQYAENPPKKYEDIYPLDFETEDWQALWEELRDIVLFWVGQGVRIFRVDNPHTKPFAFWEWLIANVKHQHPDVIFLAEAFTRPKLMYRLAKLGFTQSYTYFTWRNLKWEIEQYLTELTAPPAADFFGPNFWPNTPDILSDYLRDGGRPAFIIRLILAATLSSNYGIYGPAFELMENTRRDTTSEEYRASEKYEIKAWDLDRRDSLRSVITAVNLIRRGNAAFHGNRSLVFHAVDNEQLICYSKRSADGTNTVLVVVNLDYRYPQSGWTSIDLKALGLGEDADFKVRDLLTGTAYDWHGGRNYVLLNPEALPAHIFRVEASRADSFHRTHEEDANGPDR